MMIIMYIINNDTVGELYTRVLLNLMKLIVFKVSRFPYRNGLSNGYTCYFRKKQEVRPSFDFEEISDQSETVIVNIAS